MNKEIQYFSALDADKPEVQALVGKILYFARTASYLKHANPGLGRLEKITLDGFFILDQWWSFAAYDPNLPENQEPMKKKTDREKFEEWLLLPKLDVSDMTSKDIPFIIWQAALESERSRK